MQIVVHGTVCGITMKFEKKEEQAQVPIFSHIHMPHTTTLIAWSKLELTQLNEQEKWSRIP